MSWTDIVKGKVTNPEQIELKRNICPRCNYKWADHPEECGGYRWLRISCGIDMKSKFPIKYGEKFDWHFNNQTYDIVICRGCRGEFLDNICRNWWWNNSDKYYGNSKKEYQKCAHLRDPILKPPNVFDEDLQGYVEKPTLETDYTADVFVCGRCHVDTNVICTVKLDTSGNSNLDLTQKFFQAYQPYEFFKHDKETNLYEIKLCICCRDSLVECMGDKWWNGEINDSYHHWQ